MSETQDLVALVGSRICHDLVSPLGAIGNGLELMMLSGAEETPEMSLVNESLAGANGRIKFFRLAFGAAPAGAMVRAQDVAQALSIIGSPKLTLDWQVSGDPMRQDVKIALLAANCCETLMPFGGQITIGTDGGNWTVIGTAERFSIDEDLIALLEGREGQGALQPAKVHFALIGEEAKTQDRSLSFSREDTRIAFTF